MKNEFYLRVYYEDTDVGGVVYHSKYINFIERARSEIFFERNLSPMIEDYHFVVKELQSNFIKSAKLGDELIVKTEVILIKKASIKLKQTIYLKDSNANKLFESIVNLVCLYKSSISEIPTVFKEVFNDFYEEN